VLESLLREERLLVQDGILMSSRESETPKENCDERQKQLNQLLTYSRFSISCEGMHSYVANYLTNIKIANYIGIGTLCLNFVISVNATPVFLP